MKYGIDVSFHKDYPDWDKVAGNIDFAILAVTELHNGIDPTFEHNYQGCVDNNIKVGVYTYSYATNGEDSRNYAKLIIDTIKDKQIDLPIFLDLEWREQESYPQSRRNDIILQFKDEIEKAGYAFGIYVNKEWYYQYIPDFAKQYPIWLGWPATTGNQCPESIKPDIPNLICWQYSWTGKLPGFGNHDIDMDIWYGNETLEQQDKPYPMLAYGSTGEYVKILQQDLNAVGYNLVVDGIFGNLTKEAVKQYQSNHGLEVDGIVGPLTWNSLLTEDTTEEDEVKLWATKYVKENTVGWADTYEQLTDIVTNAIKAYLSDINDECV